VLAEGEGPEVEEEDGTVELPAEEEELVTFEKR
jgi:hypothetical protein